MSRVILALALLLVGCAAPAAQPLSPLVAGNHRLYLPIFTSEAGCLTVAATMHFARRLTTDERQQRPLLRCHPALVQAAQSRADGMVRSGHFAHCDLQGVCANSYARAAGCRLPAEYGDGNNIESIAAGSFSADAIFDALARSPSHAAHLFGQNDFFRRQGDMGIAVGIGGRYGWWWVVMIGICEG